MDGAIFDGLKLSLATRYRKDLDTVEAFAALMERMEYMELREQPTVHPTVHPTVQQQVYPQGRPFEPDEPEPDEPEPDEPEPDEPEPDEPESKPDDENGSDQGEEEEPPPEGMLTCMGCEKTQDKAAFSKDLRLRSGRALWCKRCSGLTDENVKRCKTCRTLKTTEDFGRGKTYAGGRRPNCKNCTNEAQRVKKKEKKDENETPEPVSQNPPEESEPDVRRCARGERCVHYGDGEKAAVIPKYRKNPCCPDCLRRAGL